MEYVDIATGKEISLYSIKQALPNTSFPEGYPDLTDLGYAPLNEVAKPAHNPLTQKVEAGDPALVDAAWSQTWTVVDLAPEVAAANTAAYQANLRKTIVDAVTARLDDFAKTRNYTNIYTACTYVTSTVAKFKSEADYCVSARDATWMACYAILADVLAGTRPVPSGYSDIEAELPVLAWPT